MSMEAHPTAEDEEQRHSVVVVFPPARCPSFSSGSAAALPRTCCSGPGKPKEPVVVTAAATVAAASMAMPEGEETPAAEAEAGSPSRPTRAERQRQQGRVLRSVAAKLAFLNRQSQCAGRCSHLAAGRREPESCTRRRHTQSISTSCIACRAFARWQSGRLEVAGRGHAAKAARCSFSDFFEALARRRRWWPWQPQGRGPASLSWGTRMAGRGVDAVTGKPKRKAVPEERDSFPRAGAQAARLWEAEH